MRWRMSLAFVLGLWCAGTLFMWIVATRNFAVVESILEHPPIGFENAAAGTGPAALRLMLRYQASEANRLFFDLWGWTQLPIAIAALLLARGSGVERLLWIAIGVATGIALLLQLYVVPETIHLGRLIDFLPRDPSPPEADAFWRLHHAYTSLDMLKFLCLIAAFGLNLRGRDGDRL